MTDYQLYFSNAWGQRVAVVSRTQIGKLTYVQNVNAVGTLTATIARDVLADQDVVQDARLEVWRRPDGGAWARDGGIWLLQADTPGLSERDGGYRRLKAVTANHILSRAVVLYYANSSQTSKTGNADNVMKAIVRENCGTTANSSPLYSAGAIPSRDWVTPGYLTIDGDLSLGPSVTKQFAWRNVLSVLQEIGRDAATAGTPVFFDVVPSGNGLAFRTWLGVRGSDRSTGAATLVISAARGSLGGTIEKTTDWSDTATMVGAGGQGQDDKRILGKAADLARASLSPFGRREVWVDATSLNLPASLNAEASAELRSRRATKVLTGSLQSVPGAVYGLDWFWGDKLLANHEDDSFVVSADQVTVTIDGGKETVTVPLKGAA